MPYNEYRTMGNDTIGALTEAEKVALRQQELAQALSRRSAPAAPTGPKMSPLDFLLANALQQRTQDGYSQNRRTREIQDKLEQTRLLGELATANRERNMAAQPDNRAAAFDRAREEEIARARLMQTRQDIRENRPGIPGQSDGRASFVRGQSFPDFLPPQTAATFQDGQVVMAKPTPVEKDVASMAGGPDARSSLISMLMSAIPGSSAFAPQQSASRERYERLVGGPMQEPTSPGQEITDALRKRAAEEKAAKGDYAGAAAIAQGGELPTGSQGTVLPAATLLEDLDRTLAEFTNADTSLGWDPDETDISNILRLANAADAALAEERGMPIERVREAITNKILTQLQPSARKWSGEWTKKLRDALLTRGQMADPFASPSPAAAPALASQGTTAQAGRTMQELRNNRR